MTDWFTWRNLKQVVSLIKRHEHYRNQLLTVGLFHGDPTAQMCVHANESVRHILFNCKTIKGDFHNIKNLGMKILDCHIHIHYIYISPLLVKG